MLRGDCVELGEGELAYAPLVTALRPLVRDGDPVLDRAAGREPRRARHAAAGPRRGREPTRGRGDQARVFEALLAVLDGLAREQPVLLVIEDLHWADASTRAFLRFLAAALAASRCWSSPPTGPTSCTAATRCARCWPSSSACARCASTSRGLTRDELAEQLAGHPRRAARDRARRPAVRAQRGQSAVHGGAARRGARRPRRASRRAWPRRSRCGSSGSATDAQEVVRVLSAGGKLDDRVLGRGHRAGAARAARRAARGGREPHRRARRRPLRAAPRAARARPCTTTCCPASAPSCTARWRGRSERTPGRRPERRARRGDRAPLPRRRRPAGRAHRRRARRRGRRWTCRPTARARRCSSARWSCGTACRTRAS